LTLAARFSPRDSSTSEARSMARSVPSASLTCARVRVSVRRVAPGLMAAPSAAGAHDPELSHTSRPPLLSAGAGAREVWEPDHGPSLLVVRSDPFEPLR